jgi:hypothetical protein
MYKNKIFTNPGWLKPTKLVISKKAAKRVETIVTIVAR